MLEKRSWLAWDYESLIVAEWVTVVRRRRSRVKRMGLWGGVFAMI